MHTFVSFLEERSEIEQASEPREPGPAPFILPLFLLLTELNSFLGPRMTTVSAAASLEGEAVPKGGSGWTGPSH